MVCIELLQQIPNSTVTCLNVRGTEMEHFLSMGNVKHSDLSLALHPSSGKLQELIIDCPPDNYEYELKCIDTLLGILSSPSSLQHLSIADASLAAFTPSRNLTKLTITCSARTWSEVLEDVVRIMRENQTLECLHLGHFTVDNDASADTMRVIVTALQENSTLQTLGLIPEPISPYIDRIYSNPYTLMEYFVLDTLQSIDPRTTFIYPE